MRAQQPDVSGEKRESAALGWLDRAKVPVIKGEDSPRCITVPLGDAHGAGIRNAELQIGILSRQGHGALRVESRELGDVEHAVGYVIQQRQLGLNARPLRIM
jgi:hypothetical protein